MPVDSFHGSKQVTKMGFVFALAGSVLLLSFTEFFIAAVASLSFLVCGVSFSKQMQNWFTTKDRMMPVKGERESQGDTSTNFATRIAMGAVRRLIY